MPQLLTLSTFREGIPVRMFSKALIPSGPKALSLRFKLISYYLFKSASVITLRDAGNSARSLLTKMLSNSILTSYGVSLLASYSAMNLQASKPYELPPKVMVFALSNSLNFSSEPPTAAMTYSAVSNFFYAASITKA